MTVTADEFIRRFMQHTLPPGFQRIRRYGLMTYCRRKAKLALCRKLLSMPTAELLPNPKRDHRDTGAVPVPGRCKTRLVMTALIQNNNPRRCCPNSTVRHTGVPASYRWPLLALKSAGWVKLHLESSFPTTRKATDQPQIIAQTHPNPPHPAPHPQASPRTRLYGAV